VLRWAMDGDNPDREPGPGAEIEITPEMIEAGFRVLQKSGIADVYLKADKLLVAEIFEAMFALLPQEAERSQS
jgi:hypothetical protein